MSLPIEDYALIGDCHTAALVARNGSIDWLCAPRFDSAACFASLLGDEENGRWRIAPTEDGFEIDRRYYDHTLILQTAFRTAGGVVVVTDFMPPRDGPSSHVVRIVEGRSGQVTMKSEIALRFNYGRTIPWVTALRDSHGVRAIAGPDKMILRAPVAQRGEGMQTVCEFDVKEGESYAFVLSHSASHVDDPEPCDCAAAFTRTVAFWEDWGDKPLDVGPYTDVVKRSLMVLKALTYAPTGGMAAAATTSLPESLGGVRNWDYRYCWLRDATLMVFALMRSGYHDEAQSWRSWLQRAIAGDASQLRIMYGLAGEQRLEEWEIDWLAGYENSRPVRVGNAASDQLQLDVYGQVTAAIHHARREGRTDDEELWPFQVRMLTELEQIWQLPDYSIWEARDGAEQFVFSKIMVWVAFDRAVEAIEQYGLEGPLERWRELRDVVHAEVCSRGFDPALNAFVQCYGSQALDASLLLIPMVGFLPPDDPRVKGTVEAIERDLLVDGLLLRYSTRESDDGLPPGEGAFLACSFWLVEALRLQGRIEDAFELFDRLVSLANDVGLLAEEYDTVAKRQVGNFPQAFSHVGLINAALGLSQTACMFADTQQDKAGGRASRPEREPEAVL